MKVTRFRIYHYKSIVDSGYCDLANDITILIGKNESGKTAILEALRDFDKSITEFPKSAFPMDGSDMMPKVELCFQLDASELDKLQSTSGITLPKEVFQHILAQGLSITKDGFGKYHFNDKFLLQIMPEKNIFKKDFPAMDIRFAKERLRSLMDGLPIPDLHPNLSPQEIQTKSRELMMMVKTYLPTLKDDQKQDEIVEAVRTVLRQAQNPSEKTEAPVVPPPKPENKFLAALIELLPRFVYFSEFIGHFPFAIPISKLKETDAILDFAKISGLDLEKVVNAQDVQKRINILNRHSAIINGEFGDYWKQNKIELVVKPEGEIVLFCVKELEKTDIFKIEQRSKGFQWFLSFYLRLCAQVSPNTIILVDEPGINLHAKAQKEILKILAEKVTNHQIPVILSTHSPYILDSSRLDRVRIVSKDILGETTISNHIRKDVDVDTLIPLTTALQTEKPLSSLPLKGKCNVLIQDTVVYYFLNALQEHINLPEQKQIHLILCSQDAPGSANSMSVPSANDESNLEKMISLTKGSDFDFRVILKSLNEEENQKAQQQLIEKFSLDAQKVIVIPIEPGWNIEDLFSPTDFYLHFVQRKADSKKPLTNTQYLETHNINSVVTAQGFHEKAKIRHLNFSDETLNNFQKIFDRILLGEKAVPPVIEEKETTSKSIEEILKDEEDRLKTETTQSAPKRSRWFFMQK